MDTKNGLTEVTKFLKKDQARMGSFCEKWGGWGVYSRLY